MVMDRLRVYKTKVALILVSIFWLTMGIASYWQPADPEWSVRLVSSSFILSAVLIFLFVLKPYNDSLYRSVISITTAGTLLRVVCVTMWDQDEQVGWPLTIFEMSLFLLLSIFNIVFWKVGLKDFRSYWAGYRIKELGLRKML